MKRFIAALLSLLIAFPSFALEVNGPLKNALMESSSSDPVAGVVEARFYYNTTTDKAKYYNGTDWLTIADTDSSLTNPMTTRGDLIRGGASGVPERFAAVTDNRIVRGDGTDVVLGQIDDTAFFTSGAQGTDTAHGVLKAKTTTTFTVNITGPVTTSGSFRAARSGDIVTLTWPQMITSGASSASAMTLDFSSMPSWARPVVSTVFAVFTRDNGTYGATPSQMSIPTSGNGTVNKTYASSAFTSNSGSTGLETGTVSYVGASW